MAREPEITREETAISLLEGLKNAGFPSDRVNRNVAFCRSMPRDALSTLFSEVTTATKIGEVEACRLLVDYGLDPKTAAMVAPMYPEPLAFRTDCDQLREEFEQDLKEIRNPLKRFYFLARQHYQEDGLSVRRRRLTALGRYIHELTNKQSKN